MSGWRSEEAVRGRHIPTWLGHQERVDAVHGAGGRFCGASPTRPGLCPPSGERGRGAMAP